MDYFCARSLRGLGSGEVAIVDQSTTHCDLSTIQTNVESKTRVLEGSIDVRATAAGYRRAAFGPIQWSLWRWVGSTDVLLSLVFSVKVPRNHTATNPLSNMSPIWSPSYTKLCVSALRRQGMLVKCRILRAAGRHMLLTLVVMALAVRDVDGRQKTKPRGRKNGVDAHTNGGGVDGSAYTIPLQILGEAEVANQIRDAEATDDGNCATDGSVQQLQRAIGNAALEEALKKYEAV